MPLALFLISVLVSSSMYLSVQRVMQDSEVNQALVASTAAFYTASSSAEVTWSDVEPESSLKRLEAFRTVADSSEGGLSGLGEGAALELNQGIESQEAQRRLSAHEVAFVEEYYQSSAEIALFEVPADEIIDSLEVDYCARDSSDPCPEIIVEWFRLGQGFRFQDLQRLDDLPADTSPISPCVDIPETEMTRCVVRSSMGSRGDLSLSNTSDDDFLRSFELRTDFPAYDYLVRFRSLDKKPFHFRAQGRKAGVVTGLPSNALEIDETGVTRFSYRRIRQQQAVSGGLQDGLEFVHYSHEVANK